MEVDEFDPAFFTESQPRKGRADPRKKEASVYSAGGVFRDPQERLSVEAQPMDVLDELQADDFYFGPQTKYPSMSLPFPEYREAVSKMFQEFRAETPVVENQCGATDPCSPAVYNQQLQFVRHFLTPWNESKGLLLWHDVGTGKTCKTLSAISTTFPLEGWSILWVTKKKLQSSIFKDAFNRQCLHQIRIQMAKNSDQAKHCGSEKDMLDTWKTLFKNYYASSWGQGFAKRIMTYVEFQNLFDKRKNKTRLHDLGLDGKADPLRKTVIVIDEVHNIWTRDPSSLPLPEQVPHPELIENAIWTSYKLSGNDSCKLVLLSATPTDNLLTFTRLLNLLIPDPENRFIPKELQERENSKSDADTKRRKKEQKLANYLSKLTDPDIQERLKGCISVYVGVQDPRFFATPIFAEAVVAEMRKKQCDTLKECFKTVDQKECLLRRGNFGLAGSPDFKFDSPKFNLPKMKKEGPAYSEKFAALLDIIAMLDEADTAEYGTTFKHMVYTPISALGWGTKILASFMLAHGWKMAQVDAKSTTRYTIVPAKDADKAPWNTFGLLTGTVINSNPYYFTKTSKVKNLKDAAQRNLAADATKNFFNAAGNEFGKAGMRLILLDGYFKEGIDLFNVRHVHVLQEMTPGDLMQVAGRALRRCGSTGLPFEENEGWKVFVYVYQNLAPPGCLSSSEKKSTRADLPKIVLENGTTSVMLYDVVKSASSKDEDVDDQFRRLKKLALESAVDYDLNKHVLAGEDTEFIKDASVALHLPGYEQYLTGLTDVQPNDLPEPDFEVPEDGDTEETEYYDAQDYPEEDDEE